MQKSHFRFRCTGPFFNKTYSLGSHICSTLTLQLQHRWKNSKLPFPYDFKKTFEIN